MCTGHTSTFSPPRSRLGTAWSRSTRRIRRCRPHGTSSPRKSCTGRRARCSRSGVPDRSSSRRNGCSAADVVSDGKVYDSDRVMFLRACLEQLQRATSEGVPVDGYFHWSSQDNFEWVEGFGNRFGLIYVDFETLTRTPKLSAEWFREAARKNAVV